MALWRYLDLARFVSMIQKQQLRFCRVDKFEDPFEGSYPLKNTRDFSPGGVGYSAEGWKRFVVVSCWYNSDDESDAMWRIYSSNGQGVAIRSSRERLQKIVESHGYLADMKYIDFIEERADIRIPSDVVEYKRRAFVHECEVRAIITKYPRCGFENGMPRNSEPVEGEEFPEIGHFIEIDLNELIESVIVSPYSHDWFIEVVKGLVEKYGLPAAVVSQSRLKADPVYANI